MYTVLIGANREIYSLSEIKYFLAYKRIECFKNLSKTPLTDVVQSQT